MNKHFDHLLEKTLDGHKLASRDALGLADYGDTVRLMASASRCRDKGFSNLVTYSRKVFIPLTHLCRDVCHYCTFAQAPGKTGNPYMPIDQVLEVVKQGEKMQCKEALFTLGEKPELRYAAARQALAKLNCNTTLEYVTRAAEKVLEETTLLPHINPGCMDRSEIEMLREVSASMGIMLESASARLCEKGMPHYGSPDKHPQRRLQTIKLAGELQVPLTSGILIGIGETRRERIESLLALRECHEQHGHIQEIIIQNFRAKPGTKMAAYQEPDLDELLWTIALARLIFGAQMSIQAPPNLSPGTLGQIINAGINDWGGVSPLTPDYVNPEAPWPHLEKLARATAMSGKCLHERLTIYPSYIDNRQTWLHESLHAKVLKLVDADGYPLADDWHTGNSTSTPRIKNTNQAKKKNIISKDIRDLVANIRSDKLIDKAGITRLFQARGDDYDYVCEQANILRENVSGNQVTYVVNRNINYTNICYFKCRFCAFSKGKLSENLRGTPYDLDDAEIIRRVMEAWDRGATEVCLQGGIHPDYTGETYLNICRIIKQAVPGMHIHAFSPLEIYQGAATLNMDVKNFLQELKDAGLDTLPGTAAEILDDEVRKIICPDKLNTRQWLHVVETAHEVGFRTTATIMFGHVDRYHHWATHLLQLKQLQQRTGGITEFVPLPFVGAEAPIYLKGKARRGPSYRESVLMHAVARLVLYPYINNIQTSWVKMGEQGAVACLQSGANDLGGTLMNESITRAAGATHGQEFPPQKMESIIQSIGRVPVQRTTLYAKPNHLQERKSFYASDLAETINTPIKKFRQRQSSENIAAQYVLGMDLSLSL